MKLEIAEGRIEIIMKYKGMVYGFGFNLDFVKRKEDVDRELTQLTRCIRKILEERHFFAETFDMDGSEHSIGDPDCCGSFGEVCLAHVNEVSFSPGKQMGAYDTCGGILHYQVVYGGFYHQCDLCGRTK